MRFIILLLPWLELFTLIKLGVETSALTALGYVLLTFALGVALLQRQGRGMLEHMRRAQLGEMPPGQWLLDDMVTGLCGVLLMIPGIITDILAVLLAIGPLRRWFSRGFGTPVDISRPDHSTPREPEIIEGTFRRLDDD
jgi:UPF0716 protein FxsA